MKIYFRAIVMATVVAGLLAWSVDGANQVGTPGYETASQPGFILLADMSRT